MPRYRKKPVIIEAFQWTEDSRRPGSADGWPEWLYLAWLLPPSKVGSVSPSHASRNNAVINTLEGQMLVTPGNFIIQGVQGELYPCKPDIFEATYDLVAD